MDERDGGDGCTKEMNRPVNEIHRDLGNGAEFGLAVKNVGERAAKDRESLLRRENGKRRALAHVEGADVVEAEDMVGVSVCEENCIEALHTNAKRLLAEIRRRVDDDILAIAR